MSQKSPAPGSVGMIVTSDQDDAQHFTISCHHHHTLSRQQLNHNNTSEYCEPSIAVADYLSCDQVLSKHYPAEIFRFSLSKH